MPLYVCLFRVCDCTRFYRLRRFLEHTYWHASVVECEVNAGKPDLGDQENAVQMDSLRAQVKREAEKMRQDRVNGAVKGHEE